jgi:hypothetical protein
MKKKKLLLSILCAVVFMMISYSALAELKGHSAMEMLIEARRKIGTIEFTGTPTVVQTGQAVTLSWKILPKNPQDKIIGAILIDYVGTGMVLPPLLRRAGADGCLREIFAATVSGRSWPNAPTGEPGSSGRFRIVMLPLIHYVVPAGTCTRRRSSASS